MASGQQFFDFLWLKHAAGRMLRETEVAPRRCAGITAIVFHHLPAALRTGRLEVLRIFERHGVSLVVFSRSDNHVGHVTDFVHERFARQIALGDLSQLVFPLARQCRIR